MATKTPKSPAANALSAEEILGCSLTAVIAIILYVNGVNMFNVWLTSVPIGLLVVWLMWMIKGWRHAARYGTELPEPFEVDVLYRDVVIGMLTNRQFADMFWCRYTLTPATPEAAAILTNADLWHSCQFTLLDLKTGKVCRRYNLSPGTKNTYFANGEVWLRGLYFKKPTNAGK